MELGAAVKNANGKFIIFVLLRGISEIRIGLDKIRVELDRFEQDRLRFRILELMHESGAVVEMKLRVVGALSDQRAKQVSGGGILFGFQIKAGESASEFGIGSGFVERLKRSDGFLRFSFSGLELA